MKKNKIFLCGLVFLLLVGCSDRQDELYSQVLPSQMESSLLEPAASEPYGDLDYDDPNYIGPPAPGPDAQLTPAPDDDLSGTLVIKAFQQNLAQPELYWLAREFMELHPNVTIKLDYDWKYSENLSLDERSQRQDGFYARVRTEIAAGEADYLLYGGAESMDYYRLGKNGVLEDLWPYWKNDPDIREEDYFMPVVTAFDVEGKLPVIPYSFRVRGVSLDKKRLEAAGADLENLLTVNADQLLTWYERARESDPALQLFFTAQGKDVLFRVERIRYTDFETKTAGFDSQEFISFLQRSQNVINDDPDLEPISELSRGYAVIFDQSIAYQETGKVSPYIQMPEEMNYWEHMATLGRPSLAVEENIQMVQLTSRLYPLEHIAGPYPLVSTDGHLGISAGTDNFAMPASLKNKDLAWEFIKYCLSKRDDLTFDRYGDNGCGYYCNGIPVNRAMYRQMAEDMPNYVKGDGTVGFALYQFEKVDGQAMENLMDEILTMAPVSIGKYNLDVDDYLEEFYVNELTTAEECADKIQARAEIWLNE